MKKFKRAGRGLFRGMQGGFTRMIAMVFAMRAAMIGLANVMKSAFERETLFAKLQIFERTVARTKKTFKELEDFSAKTPFLPAEVIKGFTLLRALGGKELGTVEMVKKLGDAAVTTGVGFDIIAANVGRMFNALKKGNIGQTANELRSYGLLSTEVQDKIEAMGKAGASQGALFNVFLQGLKKFDGALEIMSLTMTGVISTFKGLMIINLSDALEPWIALFKQFMIQINKAGGILKGFISISQNAFQGLEDMVFGKKKMNPEFQRFLGLMMAAPEIIMKSIHGVFAEFKKGFADANKAWSDLTGKGDVFLFVLNSIIETFLTGMAMLPKLAGIARNVVKIIRLIMTNTLSVLSKTIGTGMSFIGSFFKTVQSQAQKTITSVVVTLVSVFKHLRLGELLMASLKGDEVAMANLLGRMVGGIGKDMAFAMIEGGASIDAAVKKQAKDLQDGLGDLKDSINDMFDAFDDLKIGEQAKKDLDGLLKKIRKFITLSKIKKDLADVPGKAAKGASPTVAKFAALVTKGSAAAFKATIGQMFDTSGDAPVEEQQLITQKAILRSGETLNSLVKRQFDLDLANGRRTIRIY